MTRIRRLPLGALLAASLVAACGTVPPTPEQAAAMPSRPADELRYSNKWRIEVSEGANSDGEFVFRLTPKDGTAQVITVAVEDGTRENRVAQAIEGAFEEQLDDGHYRVEVDDGEDVLVKKRLGAPRFALEVVSSTVRSVRIRLQRE